MKTKTSAIIRMLALALVIANQIFAIFAKDYVAFVGTNVYQIISIVMTIIVAGLCAWYNNDITIFARLAGALFNSLKDGRLTPDEVQNLLHIINEKKQTNIQDLNEVKNDDKENFEDKKTK